MKIQDVLLRPEYEFIQTNPLLGSNIMLLTFGGSHAYGTNTENSDIDVRGITLNQKSDLIGLSNFEQVIDSATDTTIYSFNKIIHLLMACNPNVIEILGCRPDHYAQVSDMGRELIENRKMFLSKKALYSFGGYATSQLRRLQNNLARHTVSDKEKKQHVVNSCESAMSSFNDRFSDFGEGFLKLYVDKSNEADKDSDIFMDVNLRHYPLRDYKGIWNELNSISKEYEKLNHRNVKKDDDHLNKHAMHLIRLYLMGLDILEREEIITYREEEHDLLMDIRNGKFQNEDGSINPNFFEMVDELDKKMKYAEKHTNLPNNPDYKRIEEFVMGVNHYAVNHGIN